MKNRIQCRTYQIAGKIEVKEEEVSYILKKFKNKKASGSDKISNEMLKYGDEEL